MSSFSIENGGGVNPYKLKINSRGRAETTAIIEDELLEAVREGVAYPPSSDVVNLTSASESAVFYIKSNDAFDLVITKITIIPSPSTGGSGNALLRVYKNPTGGTIVSNALAGNLPNPNFKSTIPLEGDVFQGVEGDTITGGSVYGTTQRSNFDHPIVFDENPFLLGRGNSIAITWQPPSGNTSQDVIVFFTIYKDLNLI